MRTIRFFLDGSEKALNLACIVTLAIMSVLAVIQVFARYVLGDSLAFSGELIRYLFVWNVFLGSTIVVRKNSHAAVELFINMLPGVMRKWAMIAVFAVSAAVFAILIVQGVQLVYRVYPHNSSAMRISMSYAYAAIPFSAVFMMIYTLELSVLELLGKREPNASRDDAKVD